MPRRLAAARAGQHEHVVAQDDAQPGSHCRGRCEGRARITGARALRRQGPVSHACGLAQRNQYRAHALGATRRLAGCYYSHSLRPFPRGAAARCAAGFGAAGRLAGGRAGRTVWLLLEDGLQRRVQVLRHQRDPDHVQDDERDERREEHEAERCGRPCAHRRRRGALLRQHTRVWARARRPWAVAAADAAWPLAAYALCTCKMHCMLKLHWCPVCRRGARALRHVAGHGAR